MADSKKSLSDKINELINPNPVWEDPETEYSETTAKVVEKDDEYFDEVLSRSSLKLSHCALLDEADGKYLGKKVSRKILENESSNFGDLVNISEDSDFSDDKIVESSESELASENDISENEESGSESEVGSDVISASEEDSTALDTNQDHEVVKDTFKHISSNDISQELEKGNAVRSQIKLWDKMLEVRIQMQKCLVMANKLPQHDKFTSFKKLREKEFQVQVNHCKKEGFGLLDKLMDLQKALFLSYPETKKLGSGKARDDANDEIISSDEEEEDTNSVHDEDEVPKKRLKLSEYSEAIDKQHNNFKKFRNDSLEKWYNRSKVSVSSLKSSNFSAFDLSVLKQIDHVLQDRENLIKRTQKKRSAYRVLGYPEMKESEKELESKKEEEFDKEIFDDDDFYHKLLRELIERKAADVSDPVQLGRQWTELQKLRKKLKKKVDTKASKGRKIRYVVHSKLVNYLAPTPNNWSDSAMDDLFRSLFGKTE